jgi:hypothetical protein
MRRLLLPAALLLIACLKAYAGDSTPVAEPPAEVFWKSLESLCGKAFAGKVVESVPPDPAIDAQQLVMHVRECGPRAIRIPFHIGENRSRTWVLTRGGGGLRLEHDHRHEDGSPDAITLYGGITAQAGTATRQDFPADQRTGTLVPAAATNVWSIEVLPGKLFVYALKREGRSFRAEFDLSAPVPPPPPPWGS